MEQSTNPELDRSTKRLVAIMVITGMAVSYVLAYGPEGFPYSPLEVLLGLLMGGAYLGLSVYEYKARRMFPKKGWPFIFFSVQIFLIFGIGWFVGPGSLLIGMPLAGMAVENLSPRGRWPVYLGLVAALVLPIGLEYADWTTALINVAADSTAILFVVLFTQQRLNEREARKEAERLNIELQLANEKIAAYAAQELALAWQIQQSLMPKELPSVPGWQFAVALLPAHETSGDFYDVIPLPDGCYGIIVADVTDKGLGAALFMALSRTVLRTYALEHRTQPARVVQEANRRIMMDTQSSMYVTTFYGVLNPETGLLTYCNAGHDPPILFHAQMIQTPQLLKGTGVPIGIFEESEWRQETVNLSESDLLILYTDGVTDAENLEGNFFGIERLLQVSKKNFGDSANEICNKIVANVQDFAKDTPSSDDITLMIVTSKSL